MRRLVNNLLRWRGTPIINADGLVHVVNYSDILRSLEPHNRTLVARERITYDSLWVHSKRHYDNCSASISWRAHWDEVLKEAFALPMLIQISHKNTVTKYEGFGSGETSPRSS